MPYGEQTLWPDHCVQGSEGARFHAHRPQGLQQAVIVDAVLAAAHHEIGDVIRAVVGVTSMAFASAMMAPTERAAALAIGYGSSQAVAAVLLVRRVHQLTGAMSSRITTRLLLETLVAALVAVAVMVAVVSWSGTGRRDSLQALLVGGSLGVLAFGLVSALLSRRSLFGLGR